MTINKGGLIMSYENAFTFRTEDIDRVRKLYDAAASPEEIANIIKWPLWYINEIISLIRQSRK